MNFAAWLSPARETTAISIIAAALWGSGDFCGALAVRRISPYAVVTLAHGLSLLLLLAVAVALKVPLPGTHSIGIAVAAGIAGGIGLVFLYEALALGKMGLAASVGGVITAVVPVIFSVLSAGLPHVVQLAGFVTAVVAIWMIASASGSAQPRALWLAAGAGLCFGILLTLLKLAGGGGVIWAMVFARLGSFATAALLTATHKKPAQQSSASALKDISLVGLIALAGALDTGGNLVYTVATRIGRLDIAAVVSSLYPAATILLAAWILKERTTPIQATGMALALVAVALISS